MDSINGVLLPSIQVTRLLVCGGRDFIDGDYVWKWLTLLRLHYSFLVLIHGGARGADTLADIWAKGNGLQPCRCDALWDYHRRRGHYWVAGSTRNAAMLVLQPQLVVAFPGGDGTANMLKQARECGVERVNLAEHYARNRAA